MPDESSARTRLRQELARARDLAGVSGRAMAAQIGVSRETIRRFDAGDALLAVPKIVLWLGICQVEEPDRQRILDLAEYAVGETRPWRELLDAEGHLQEQSRRREQVATLVQNFQPTVVPGLLQTPEYARLTFEAGHTRDIAAAVAGRMERQQVLYDGTARFEFLITEHALTRVGAASTAVLAAQRDRIASLAKLGSVTVRTVPDTAPVLPWHNFILWTNDDEQRYVTTELIHGPQEIYDEGNVAVYADLWVRLSEVSDSLDAG